MEIIKNAERSISTEGGRHRNSISCNMDNSLQGANHENQSKEPNVNDTLNISSSLIQDTYDSRVSHHAALNLKEFKKHQNIKRDNFMTDSNQLVSDAKQRNGAVKGDVAALEKHRKSASIAIPQNPSDSSFTLERRS